MNTDAAPATQDPPMPPTNLSPEPTAVRPPPSASTATPTTATETATTETTTTTANSFWSGLSSVMDSVRRQTESVAEAYKQDLRDLKAALPPLETVQRTFQELASHTTQLLSPNGTGLNATADGTADSTHSAREEEPAESSNVASPSRVETFVDAIANGIASLLEDTIEIVPPPTAINQNSAPIVYTRKQMLMDELRYDVRTYELDPVDVFHDRPESLERYRVFIDAFRMVKYAESITKLFGEDANLRLVHSAVGMFGGWVEV